MQRNQKKKKRRRGGHRLITCNYSAKSSSGLINSPNGLNVFGELVWLFSYACFWLNYCLFVWSFTFYSAIVRLWKGLWFFRLLLLASRLEVAPAEERLRNDRWHLFLPVHHLWPLQFCSVHTLLFKTRPTCRWRLLFLMPVSCKIVSIFPRDKLNIFWGQTN